MKKVFLVLALLVLARCSSDSVADTLHGMDCKCESVKSEEKLYYGSVCPEKDAEGNFYYTRGHYVNTQGREVSVCFSVKHACACKAE